MKLKSIFYLIAIFFLLIGALPQAYGAMTCVDSGTKHSNGAATLTVTCTFDTTPGTASDSIPFTVMERGDGKRVRLFATKNGSTGPTDDSDLAITDERGVKIIDVAGSGADVVDNAATNIFYGDGPGTANHEYMIHSWSTWTVAVTNNAVNNSSFILYLEVADE